MDVGQCILETVRCAERSNGKGSLSEKSNNTCNLIIIASRKGIGAALIQDGIPMVFRSKTLT